MSEQKKVGSRQSQPDKRKRYGFWQFALFEIGTGVCQECGQPATYDFWRKSSSQYTLCTRCLIIFIGVLPEVVDEFMKDGHFSATFAIQDDQNVSQAGRL